MRCPFSGNAAGSGGCLAVQIRPAWIRTHNVMLQIRGGMAPAFHEDLGILLIDLLDEKRAHANYVPPEIPDGSSCPVDTQSDGKNRKSVFLFGVPNQDTARLKTVILSHFPLHHGLTFESVIVFAGQQQVLRLDRLDPPISPEGRLPSWKPKETSAGRSNGLPLDATHTEWSVWLVCICAPSNPGHRVASIRHNLLLPYQRWQGRPVSLPLPWRCRRIPGWFAETFRRDYRAILPERVHEWECE